MRATVFDNHNKFVQAIVKIIFTSVRQEFCRRKRLLQEIHDEMAATEMV